MRHKKTGITYQWPTSEMIDHIRSLGCNVVPVGFQPPRKDHPNKDQSIEWEILFTKAEQYICRNLHHPKVRVYMFSLLMLKCFFASSDPNVTLIRYNNYSWILIMNNINLREKHIRHTLFRMIENTPVDWTEENIGEKFLDLWDIMLKRLEKQSLPNFFMKNSNMFATISNHRLRFVRTNNHH